MDEQEKVFDEIKTEEVTTVDNFEESGGGLLGALVVGTVALGGVIAGFVYKNRDKLEQRKIKKLEKKGYTVIKPEEVVEPDEPNDAETE